MPSFTTHHTHAPPQHNNNTNTTTTTSVAILAQVIHAEGGLSSAATADHLQVHSCSFTVCTASCLFNMLVIPWRVVKVVSCFSCAVLPFLVRTWSGLAHANGIKSPSISMPLRIRNALFGALGTCPRFRCLGLCPRVHLRCLRLRRRRRRRPWARRLRSPFCFCNSAGIACRCCRLWGPCRYRGLGTWTKVFSAALCLP